MALYRQRVMGTEKSIEVEAYRCLDLSEIFAGNDRLPSWLLSAIKMGVVRRDTTLAMITGKKREIVTDYDVIIQTLDGLYRVMEGDFIIQGVKGELYPCKPDIFQENYEEVKI